MGSRSRYLSVLALLVLGLLIGGVWGAAGSLQTTYTATRVSPGADAARIANADGDVLDLDAWVDSMPPAADAVIENATANGTYRGSVPPELYMRVDDYDGESHVAVYRGRYYRLNATVDEETTETTLTAAPLSPDAAAAAAATPYGEAGPIVRRAVGDGSASTAEFAVDPGLVSRGDAYYLVTPQNGGAAFGKFLATVLGAVIRPIGRAYAVAAVALLAALRRRGTDRPLDQRGALAAAGGTVAVMWVWTVLATTGAVAFRYVFFPSMGLVTALGLLAGVYVRRGEWRRLVGLSVGSFALCQAAVGLSMRPVGLFFSTPALVLGWVGSLLLAVYGYAFTPPVEGSTDDAPTDAAT